MENFSAFLEVASESEMFEKGMGVLNTLLQNIIQHPGEEKYRRVRTTNARLRETLFALPGADEIMEAQGWEKEGEFFVLRDGYNRDTITAAQVLIETKLPKKQLTPEQEAREAAIKEKLAKERAEKEKILGSAKEDQARNQNRKAVASTASGLNFGSQATTFHDIGVDTNKGG